MLTFFWFSICMMRQKDFFLILIQDTLIKFTMETEVNKVIPFLDIHIDNYNNILNTITYHKLTYSDCMFLSCHVRVSE